MCSKHFPRVADWGHRCWPSFQVWTQVRGVSGPHGQQLIVQELGWSCFSHWARPGEEGVWRHYWPHGRASTLQHQEGEWVTEAW